jgi:amidase
VSPAEKSGIVGFKPTRNVISSEGLIHASKTLDTVGLLTRSVDDARSILREITQHSAHHTTESKAKFLNQLSPKPFPNLKTIRIGIPSLTLFTNFHPAKTTAFTNALSALEEAGATIAKNVHIPGHETYTSLSPAQKSIILDTDMKLAIECYLSSLTTNPQNIHTLQDLITFTQNCAEEEYPTRNTAVLERALLTSPSNSLYLDMLALDEYFSTGLGSIANALDNHACDVLIIPTLDPTLQTLAAKAGSPVVSVPIGVFGAGTNVQVDPGNGMVDIGPGIPFSAYIFGRVDCDGEVLGVAQVLKREMKVRDMLEPYLEAVTEVRDV